MLVSLGLDQHIEDLALGVDQGCLVLRYCGDFEHEIDVESGSPASVSDVVTSRSPDQIIGEGAQAREDSGVLANAGGVLGKAVSRT